MSSAAAPRRAVGRPRDLAKIEAVLDAGWSLFLERGVAAVSIEAIAARAKVSKGTLYHCFADKTALFEAAVQREMERIEASQGVMRGAPAQGPLADTLRSFGCGIMRFLASEPAISFYSALAAELRLHPKLAEAFWALGPGQTRSNLAAILEAAARRGEIMIDDPVMAAEALFGLWQGFSNLQLALGLPVANLDAWIRDRVERGNRIFMQAHRPPRHRRQEPIVTKKAAMDPPSHLFVGFAPQALAFFTELEAHQTREWFLAHKARYDEHIRKPLGQLLEALTSSLAQQGLPLQGDLKNSVFRINRDVRFGKDKRPYKTHASAVLTRDGTKHSPGLLYLQLGPTECFIAAGFYALETGPLEAFRRAILAQPRQWRAVVSALDKSGLPLVRDDALARLPRGYSAAEAGELGEDLRLKSFVVRLPLEPDGVTRPDLVERVTRFALHCKPLLEFGWRALP